jgi:hypothetical protein
MWGAKARGKASVAARQIGATAAALAIPLMNEKAAAKLAAAEGIVTHLTSLVLIDEAGERCAGLPASRKVALSAPKTGVLYCLGPIDWDAPDLESSGSQPQRRMSAKRELGDNAMLFPHPAPKPSRALDQFVDRIDWDADPEALRRGDLSGVPPEAVLAIHVAAKSPEIVAFAAALKLDPIVVVIGLLARAAGGSNRSAQRLARAILGATQEEAVATVMHEIGL